MHLGKKQQFLCPEQHAHSDGFTPADPPPSLLLSAAPAIASAARRSVRPNGPPGPLPSEVPGALVVAPRWTSPHNPPRWVRNSAPGPGR
ncbi:hypothetical protein D623_10003782 [Myotis brandtii]|uniref:Uncharacterized protein n=1 Tax=Myotis brandtii TaxID=109478 RepID=S7MM67_MYOBR|nr:hypothetical protein D623_10003782 [Myotis brandtii]